jgi:NitT/TauT family transport system permease protein
MVTLVWVVGIIILWEVLALALQYLFRDPMAATKLPYPHSIVMTIAQNWQSLLADGAITLSRASIGFIIGALIGFILAILMSLSKILEKITFPYLIISQMIPVLGLAPIIFNIVQDMNTSRIIIAAYITFFPVSVNMLSGLKSVELEKKELLYSIAANQYDVYYKLMIPASMPYLMTGLKITAPMAVTASILVDMLGSSSGIGVRILYSLYSGSPAIFWAAVVTSAIMGILSYYIVVLAETFLLPWKKNVAPQEAGANE